MAEEEKYIEPTWLTEPEPTQERLFAEWLNTVRGFTVQEVFHEIMQKYAEKSYSKGEYDNKH